MDLLNWNNFQQKVHFYMTIIKAIYDAADQAISGMTGKSNRDALKKWDDQLNALLDVKQVK